MKAAQQMAESLDSRQLLKFLSDFKRGDFSVRLPYEQAGVTGKICDTLNDIIEQNQRMTLEFERISTVVGKEGRIKQRASLPTATGGWNACIESVNTLVVDLVQPTTEVARVIGAVAKGDLSQSMGLEIDGRPLTGEFLRTAKIVNTMVDQLSTFASEVTRVAREVGTEGKLGGQAQVKGVAGTWKDLTDNVNFMAGNLTTQVRNIAEVATAIANGDLSRKIAVDVKGEVLELKNTINTMVDQLNSFASEVTRVAREVGTEGKLGGQAHVKGVAGTWKDLTDNVNFMAGNLTAQVRNIAGVATAIANGDLSKKITVDVRGEILELKNTINTMVDQLNSFASEVTRVAREVGTEGKLGVQAQVKGVAGTWKDLTDNVNFMASNLTSQVRNIADVTTAVAKGDLSKKITVDVRGEILELKNTINTMVDQLNSFASEVTRVAREVGSEGKLGGQAEVKGVGGTWKDLTENVNSMAGNLTNQVRGIAKVVTAVANGNLKRKLVLEAKGEIEELAETINGMIDTLATFADQVSSVAREVGSEGKLGGQASVPGAAGTWRDLTDNVNRLAANLTTQVRAIAEVSTAVTKGDLSRSIAVEAAGEVAALKDNINEMIRNLKDTTQKNTEQDWLKTNLAKFTRMLQGQRDLLAVSRLILSELAPLVSMQHGIFYLNESQNGEADLKLLASYAYKQRKHVSNHFRTGEGLVGQCAFEKERILLTEVPGDYIQVNSGLGEAPPLNIVVLPVLFETQVKAVIELASFQNFSETHLNFLDQLTESIGIVLNTITATMRTEELLKQSQTLAAELQTRQEELTETNRRLQEQARSLQASEERLKQQQEELQQTNEELEEKAELLAKQNLEVENKNREIERASQSLQDKAAQLALTSKYKSEFLANMSHELRTPLNSLLILSNLLIQNSEDNLSAKQLEFVKTIHSSGSDLLELINDILDLSKIESGTMEVDVTPVSLNALQEFAERTFRQVALGKGLEFTLESGPQLPEVIHTDSKRIQQVLKNLLSNAFKFTEIGSVVFRVDVAREGWSEDQDALNRAHGVLAFSVKDTGIGIPHEKHQVIFEAFQQADGTTSRKYGGTGLGLSISRDIASRLGGEIKLKSSAGEGSTFTLYLPQRYSPVAAKFPSRGWEETSGWKRRPISSRLSLDSSSPMKSELPDDRDGLEAGDRVLLIIEDDIRFARILLDRAHEMGFKGLVALSGETGLRLAQRFKPQAITLDIELPEMDGWTVLDQLKYDLSTRHIPVHILSVAEDRHRGLRQGALAFLNKPISVEGLNAVFAKINGFIERQPKQLLIVEDDSIQRTSIMELIGNGDVHTTTAGTGQEALGLLKDQRFDCMVLDLGLPDMSGFELIERIKGELRDLPIIIYTGKDLTKSEETELRRVAETIIVKDVKSLARLLDETSLFLHRVGKNLPEPKRKMLEHLRQTESPLAGKKVLIVDDDIRNIFALTSVFENYQMQVAYAENGKDGVQILQQSPDLDVIIMDVMMPEMDGYEAMREIRKIDKFYKLPIIALTAKAMKGDREKCIEAGASDYVVKPIDTGQLMSLLRVWLYR